ncbi:hypothetical protein SCWH03_26390 [Streptomyces pacificus]|uniref:Uncharacterized protein n=1 Tax=Streptomyces pacificus TaxID=2705029 RepID=A0A6A0AVQ0_9ACTN|nr:hypothetical protein SCWH03_26390 [Streptomyces pacificus]
MRAAVSDVPPAAVVSDGVITAQVAVPAAATAAAPAPAHSRLRFTWSHRMGSQW